MFDLVDRLLDWLLGSSKVPPREWLRTLLAVKQGSELKTLTSAVTEAQIANYDPMKSHWEEWKDGLVDFMESGDELWTFASPEWTWRRLMGRGGLAIVRNGVIVRAHLCAMN